MTRFAAYIAEAFEAIWRNRTRSLLTMLGMIIGTSSIIAVLGISHAAQGGITGTLDSFGDQGININVDGNQDDPNAAQIQYRDVRTIATELGPRLEHIEPSWQRNFPLSANGIKYTTFVASASDYYKDQIQMHEGRRLERDDVASAAHVVALSKTIADKFFPNRSALGGVLKIGNVRFTVIGVFEDVKGGFFASIGGNDYALIPYTTYHELVPGPVDQLTLYRGPGESVDSVSNSVIAILQRLHGSKSLYQTQDNVAQFQQFNSVLSVIGGALTAIGGVALVVAGIGIMNIMLVSVTERTREIGLRKSIGAARRDILLQFLLEAILLSFIGGGIGTLLGFGVTLLAYSSIEALVGPAPIPYLLIISIAVGFSTLVGTVFGTYPAYRASRLDPITALRS